MLWSGVEGTDVPPHMLYLSGPSRTFLSSFLARANSDNHSPLKAELDQNSCLRLLSIACTVRIVRSHVLEADTRILRI